MAEKPERDEDGPERRAERRRRARRGAIVAALRPQIGPERPPAIHRKCGDEVEEREREIEKPEIVPERGDRFG